MKKTKRKANDWRAMNELVQTTAAAAPCRMMQQLPFACMPKHANRDNDYYYTDATKYNNEDNHTSNSCSRVSAKSDLAQLAEDQEEIDAMMVEDYIQPLDLSSKSKKPNILIKKQQVLYNLLIIMNFSTIKIF